MAAGQQVEVQLAQRLASNEKPVRTRAMKKLRKYINVRSQQGVFSGEELLKLWKGLFYCLWMQDKPLLQEDLSRQISTLIHSFHTTEQQLSYLQSFLQTMKREWTGIDQLRMDKFFQLVRFMFRQAFEMLRRRSWDSSMVSQFLELLTAQLLQKDGMTPSGLQLHVLDLYLTELEAVGATELTADQNLTFIEPFCITAARTKDWTLFSSICSSIFSTIIDQAPFAIEDLIKEMKAAKDSDSGQSSDEDGEEPGEEETKKEREKKQINGKKSDQEEEEEDEEFLHLKNLDSDSLCDEDVGPVLQFDYAALAAKLLEISSQRSTSSPNRQRLYNIVKTLQNLSKGIFPPNEYPEEVSTDEDDDMFGSRKRMKRRRRHTEVGEEEEPAVKKGKKKEEAADVTAENKKKKKKKRKKKEKQTEQSQTTQEEAAATAGVLKATETDHKDQSKKKTETPPTSEPADAPISEKSSVMVNTGTCEVFGKEITALPPPESNATTPAKKKRKKNKGDGNTEQPEQTQKAQEEAAGTIKVTETEAAETLLHSESTTQPDHLDQPKKKKQKNSEAPPTAELDLSEKKKKKKKRSVTADTGSCEALAEETLAQLESDAAAPANKKEKKKKKKAAAEREAPVNAGNSETGDTPAPGSDATTAKKKSITADEEQADKVPQLATKKKGKREETTCPTPAETPQKKKKDQREASEEEEGHQEANAGMTPAKKKKSRKQDAAQLEACAGDMVASNTEPAVKKRRKIPVVFEFEADELQAANGVAEEETAVKKPRRTNDEMATPLNSNVQKKKKKQQGGGGSPSDFITFQSKAKTPKPLFCKTKGSPRTLVTNRKFQTPKLDSKKVTFGLKNNKTAEFRKSDRSLLVSPDGSSRVPFDPQQKPKFGVLKSPPTPLSVKKTPIRRKKGDATQSTPKRRSVASDFF